MNAGRANPLSVPANPSIYYLFLSPSSGAASTTLISWCMSPLFKEMCKDWISFRKQRRVIFAFLVLNIHRSKFHFQTLEYH